MIALRFSGRAEDASGDQMIMKTFEGIKVTDATTAAMQRK